MTGCQKCWHDAFRRSYGTEKCQAEVYQDILEERKDHHCTPRQQAGDYWDEEKQCDSRFPDEVI